MQLQNYFAQDKSGNALPGATVYVLLAGTATMATGLQDKNGAAKANPFLSDSQGLIQFAVANGDYDIRVVKGPHDYKLTSVRFEDSKQFRLDAANNTDPAKGAALVGFQQSGIGSVGRTVRSKLLEYVSVKDFGAIGDGVTDDTSAIQSAITMAVAARVALYVPAGSYLVSRSNTYVIQGYGAGSVTVPYALRITDSLRIFGDGVDASRFLAPMSTGLNTNILLLTDANDCVIEHIGAERIGAASGTGLYSGSLVSADRCSNLVVQNCYTKNIRGLVNFFGCIDSTAVDCFAERSDTTAYSGSHFGSYQSTACSFVRCVGYGGTNDGDITHYGNGFDNSIVGCKLYNYVRGDAAKAIVSTIAQGFCIDAGQGRAMVSGSKAYGYYYGFDVKSNCEHVTVSECIAIKNKVGIAIRRGEVNAPTIYTTVEGCTVLPDGGNGNATVVMDGFTVVGIWLQDAVGTLINGNTIGKGYRDTVASDVFLPFGEVRSNLGTESVLGWTRIVNNKFVNEVNFAGNNKFNSAKFISMSGTSNSLRNILISNNEFKNRLQVDVSYDFITISQGIGLTVANNSFGIMAFGTTGSTGGSIRLNTIEGACIEGNLWLTHGQLLNATACSKVSFNDNVMRNGVGGSSTPQIYLDNVRGFMMADNNYDFSGGGFTDGRPLESVNTPATGRYVIQGNLFSITNFGTTNWYRIDGVDIPYRADFLVRDNLINGTRMTGALTASATLDFPSIAAAGSQSLTISLTGAVVGDSVDLGLPSAPASGIVFNAYVSAVDTVTVRASNITESAVDPASASYRVTLSNR